jgi:hypothetical protein
MDTQSLHTLLVDKREILEGIIHKDIYRYQRYDIPFSVAIFYASCENAIDTISKAIRETDEVIQIDKHFTCVIFGFVSHEDAYVGALNTLKELRKYKEKETFSAGLTSITPRDGVSEMVLRAIRNLHFAMDEKNSVIKDDGVIDFISLH